MTYETSIFNYVDFVYLIQFRNSMINSTFYGISLISYLNLFNKINMCKNSLVIVGF